MSDKMREEFEAWWISANPRLTDLPKEQAYYIWQASRAALVVELPNETYYSVTEYENEVALRLKDAGIKYE